jgi:hypothetical protein
MRDIEKQKSIQLAILLESDVKYNYKQCPKCDYYFDKKYKFINAKKEYDKYHLFHTITDCMIWSHLEVCEECIQEITRPYIERMNKLNRSIHTYWIEITPHKNKKTNFGCMKDFKKISNDNFIFLLYNQSYSCEISNFDLQSIKMNDKKLLEKIKIQMEHRIDYEIFKLIHKELIYDNI